MWYKKFAKKRNFKACADRKTTVYRGVNEDFESKRNAEITFYQAFTLRRGLQHEKFSGA